MPEHDVFYRITVEYYHLATAEKKVADYVIANRHQIHTLSISEVAQDCGVAVSTISRFCRKIRCTNFSTFKLEVATACARHSDDQLMLGQPEERQTIQERFSATATAHIEGIREGLLLADPAEITKAVDWMEGAETVLCMGQGSSGLMAQEAANIFMSVRKNVIHVPDGHSQLLSTTLLSPTDLILYFSYTGSTKELQELLTLAKKKDVKTVLITRYPRSHGALGADCVLQCGSLQTPLQMGGVSARVAQLFVVDLLFGEYTHRNLADYENKQKDIIHALSVKHL